MSFGRFSTMKVIASVVCYYQISFTISSINPEQLTTHNLDFNKQYSDVLHGVLRDMANRDACTIEKCTFSQLEDEACLTARPVKVACVCPTLQWSLFFVCLKTAPLTNFHSSIQPAIIRPYLYRLTTFNSKHYKHSIFTQIIYHDIG